MPFSLTDITAGDLRGVGVIGLADTPGLDTASMQNKFEETARSVIIPKLNEVIDELVANGMTRAEISQEIEDRIAYVGGGDMAKAVYDTDDDGVVDNAARLNGLADTDFVKMTDTNNFYVSSTSNPAAVATTANDTPTNWKTIGNGMWAIIGSGHLNNQPTANGYILNFNRTGSSGVMQLWLWDELYVRKGSTDSNTWTIDWKRIFTSTSSNVVTSGSSDKTLGMKLESGVLKITWA